MADEVKAALACTKNKQAVIEQEEQIDSKCVPLSLEKGKTISKNLIPGQSHVQTGHRYMKGLEVKEDYLEALNHFKIADELENAEGTFNLAEIYLYGKGVQQDISRGIELLKRAAYALGEESQNAGVREAQTLLGTLYEQGVHLPKDTKEAIKLYESAAKNGAGSAAFNLGVLYFEGRDVEQDMKKAIMYWNLGVELKNEKSSSSLFTYYMTQMEPKQARIMYNKNLEFGNENVLMVREIVYGDLRKIEKKRKKLEPEVIAFEKKNNLSASGMTFHERLLRKTQGFSGSGEITTTLPKTVNNVDEILNPNERWTGRWKDFHPDNLLHHSLLGSVTAQRILRVLSLLADIKNTWNLYQPPFTESQSQKLIDIFHQCMITERHVIGFEDGFGTVIMQFIENLLHMNGHKMSEFDKKLRICYAWGNRGTAKLADVLMVGRERYPDEPVFYSLLSEMMHTMNPGKGNMLGLKIANDGLSRFPDDIELLHNKAVNTHLLKIIGDFVDNLEVRSAYEKFIEKAPRDHRHVPDAYYGIATTYMEPEDQVNILKYYEMGKEAEKIQMACYLPYESSSKRMLEANVKGWKQAVKVSGSSKAIKSREEKETPRDTNPRNSRQCLKNESRHQLIRRHREALSGAKKIIKQKSVKPNMRSFSNSNTFADLKPIKLNEMDANKDGVYEGHILTLTIIEDPIRGAGVAASFCTLGEDENGDLTYIHVNDKAVESLLVYGSRVSVINPNMRMGSDDLSSFAWVDDSKSIVYERFIADMCRYCGEGNSQYSCGNCKWAKYCSKECQKRDWKVLRHKIICA